MFPGRGCSKHRNTFRYDVQISLSTEYKYLEQLQARKLKYKLEDVRRRGRRDEVGKVDGELGRSEQAGKSEVEKLARTDQVGRADGEKVKEEQHEQEEEEREERSEVTQVCNIFSSFHFSFSSSI